MSQQTKPHNFRVVHLHGVSTTPRVIQCLNTGRLSHELSLSKPCVVTTMGQTFLVMKYHVNTRRHVVIKPYEGNWPRLTFWTKRVLEVFL